jgi:Cu(I)/Ag(I) efflux system membrane fusion protein
MHADPPAPGQAAPLSRWQKFRLVVKVVEMRLRFIALMAATGLVFGYWDYLWNLYAKSTRPPRAHAVAQAGVEFYCPMHPDVVQEQPGNCPICGMPLSKREKGEAEVLPEGVTARVQLAPFRIAQAGIRTVPVSYAPLNEVITTVGYVSHDQRRVKRIDSKIPGRSRIERLVVNYEGMAVEPGQTLAEVYAPELDAALRELLLNKRRADESAAGRTGYGRQMADDARQHLALSVEKLKRWGITQSQIDEALRTGRTEVDVPITAPIGGHVVEKHVAEGQYVNEGDPLFVVADLHAVWIEAKVFEDQIPLLSVGQAVEATVESFPGETFAGTVAFIAPHLDPATRTIDVRYDMENPGHRLRPGMFATVTIRTPVAELPAFRAKLAAAPRARADGRDPTPEEQGTCPVTSLALGSMGDPVPVDVEDRKVWTCCAGCPPKLEAEPGKYLARLGAPPEDQVLSVPESAVIDTGTRTLVYVESEPGVFDGREVVLGPRAGDRYPVLEGLRPGEVVAAAGAFLIDAETRLNPAAADPLGGKAGGDAPATPHAH